MSKLHAAIAAALVLSLLGGSSAATVMAQSGDEVTPAAGINADTVDGKHAVKANANPQKRANKLVATDSQGLLPSDILKPLWSLLQGIPAVLADGQVAFAEITGMPAGFADGVDNGITKVTITQVVAVSAPIAPGNAGIVYATCPAGSRVVGGGHTTSSYDLYQVVDFAASATAWLAAARNQSAANQTVTSIAQCMAVEPSTAIAVAKKWGVKPATGNKPPAPKKRG
jgi:hypothetical protein